LIQVATEAPVRAGSGAREVIRINNASVVSPVRMQETEIVLADGIELQRDLAERCEAAASALMGRPLDPMTQPIEVCGRVVTVEAYPREQEEAVPDDPPLPVVLDAQMTPAYYRAARRMARHAVQFQDAQSLLRELWIVICVAFVGLCLSAAVVFGWESGAGKLGVWWAAAGGIVMAVGLGGESVAAYQLWHQLAIWYYRRIAKTLEHNESLTWIELRYLLRKWGSLIAWPQGRREA
jgi:hypothetical protein